jgi:hypothetical protein
MNFLHYLAQRGLLDNTPYGREFDRVMYGKPPKAPDPAVEEKAEAKRQRRRERNLRNMRKE